MFTSVPSLILVGEWEQANLGVQLARTIVLGDITKNSSTSYNTGMAQVPQHCYHTFEKCCLLSRTLLRHNHQVATANMCVCHVWLT